MVALTCKGFAAIFFASVCGRLSGFRPESRDERAHCYPSVAGIPTARRGVAGALARLAGRGLGAQSCGKVRHAAGGGVVPAALESDLTQRGIALRNAAAQAELVATLSPDGSPAGLAPYRMRTTYQLVQHYCAYRSKPQPIRPPAHTRSAEKCLEVGAGATAPLLPRRDRRRSPAPPHRWRVR